MGKLFIGTNLKMYKTTSQTVEYLEKLESLTDNIADDINLFVIPSFTALESAKAVTKKGNIRIGAQNMHWEDEGQFTGEISPLMLKDLDIEIIEIGHSERRHVMGETDIEENKKVLAALKHGFTALLCIGETDVEKDSNITKEVLSKQLKVGLKGVSKNDVDRIWIAYEPVWAIGVNGKPASSEYAQMVHEYIKEVLNEIFEEDSQKIPVLYGGSVNPQNAEDLIVQKDIDGLFVGRSAWDAEKFNVLINDVLPLYKGK
jgi:triosephosphate isomerase